MLNFTMYVVGKKRILNHNNIGKWSKTIFLKIIFQMRNDIVYMKKTQQNKQLELIEKERCK